MKRLIIFLSILLITLSTFTIMVGAATKVTEVKVLGIEPPEATNTPDNTAYVASSAYSVFSQPEWYDVTDGYFLESGDVFIKGHVYKVNVWIEANDGYEFATKQNGSPDVVAYIDSNEAIGYKAYEYKGFAMVDVSYTFAPCPSKSITHLDIQMNMGLTELEEGTYAPFSFTCTTAQIQANPSLNYDRYYPSGVYWSNSTASSRIYNGDKFKGGYDYYVELAIAPLYGSHTFAEGMTVNINGKEATIKLRGDSHAIVGAEFTCFGSIYHYDVNPHVILPKAGNTPDYEPAYYYPQCNHIQYACINGWYDAESGERLTRDDKFEAGKSYTVEIECMANYPYRFLRDSNDKMKYPPYVTGHKVDSYSFSYDSYRGRELIKLVKTFTVAEPEHTHTAGGWQCDDSGHKQYCTVCGTDMGGSAHFGGTATCTNKAVCEVCGYGYGELEEHRWSPKYHPVSAAGHAFQCADCKGYDTLIPHDPGPAATEIEPQTCKECGYIIEPAKNHTHTLYKVPMTEPTCTDEGYMEYYACKGCAKRFEDEEGKTEIPTTKDLTIPAKKHTAAEKWMHDEQGHWKNCTVCNMQTEEAKQPHEFEDGTCSVCGYNNGEPSPDTGIDTGIVTESDTAEPSEQTEPVTDKTKADTTKKAKDTDADTENEDGLDLLPVLFIVGAVAIAAGILTAMIIIKNKKENQK